MMNIQIKIKIFTTHIDMSSKLPPGGLIFLLYPNVKLRNITGNDKWTGGLKQQQPRKFIILRCDGEINLQQLKMKLDGGWSYKNKKRTK